MNLFDTPLNLEDENLLLSVKSLDQSGFQKWVNLIDAGRAMISIARTNWYYGFKTSPALDVLGNPQISTGRESLGDPGDPQDPGDLGNLTYRGDPHSDGICLFQDALDSFRIFTDLEPWEVTTQHIACTLEPFQALRAWLEAVIEYSVNTATTFPTKVEFARQVLPPCMAVMESLSAIYEEAAKNTLSSLDLEARQVLGKSMGAEIPDGSPSVGKPRSPMVDVSDFPHGLDTEDAHYFRMLEVLSRYQRMMSTEPSTAKALMGKNLLELLQAASLFFNSRGQSLQKELKAAKIW